MVEWTIEIIMEILNENFLNYLYHKRLLHYSVYQKVVYL